MAGLRLAMSVPFRVLALFAGLLTTAIGAVSVACLMAAFGFQFLAESVEGESK